MAKFYGPVGYAGSSIEKEPGVWVDQIEERTYYGDVNRVAIELREAAVINPDLVTQNSISIVADAYAFDNFFAIRYVEWAGTRWAVSSVEVQSPRLILILGGVYNGPVAPPAA